MKTANDLPQDTFLCATASTAGSVFIVEGRDLYGWKGNFIGYPLHSSYTVQLLSFGYGKDSPNLGRKRLFPLCSRPDRPLHNAFLCIAADRETPHANLSAGRKMLAKTHFCGLQQSETDTSKICQQVGGNEVKIAQQFAC